MNGAKAITETLAKRRLFFSSLPGMAASDKREQDMLTTNAADLLPVETPWMGTPRSPLFLLETPYRQLIPFSPFDPSLSDANVLIMAKSEGGKTFMVQQLLSMASRANPLVSIIERGDSYRPLVELMGGRMITMSLDTDQTINPWDLPRGERQPSKDQVAFLKNLTRHMLGENPAEDTELLDNLITEAILRTYKRAAIRPSNPIPIFTDLRDELAQWRDEEKNQRVMDEAHLAAIKLRSWTGEKGIYSRLFDHPTTISLDTPWLFFNVELHQIKHFSAPRKGRSADALIVIGEKADTTHTIRMVPTPLDYWITTTYARERIYRAWWISQHKDIPLIEAYRQLARKFPFGLADVEPLPEEQSREVAKGAQK